MQFTGPPKINTLTLPHASFGTPVEGEERTEDVTLQYRDRRTEVIARYLTRRWTLGWDALDYATALDLITELRERSFAFTPRTQADGDPDTFERADGTTLTIAETAYTCRLTSPLPREPRLRVDATGTRVTSLRLEIETLTAEAIAPALDVGTPPPVLS